MYTTSLAGDDVPEKRFPLNDTPDPRNPNAYRNAANAWLAEYPAVDVMKEPEGLRRIEIKDGEKKDALRAIDPEEIAKLCYQATFKIYQQTNFNDIKRAACQYWNLKEISEWVITDEYFNVLSSFQDTCQNLFNDFSGYQCLDTNCYAVCYLIKKNKNRQACHYL